MPAFKLKSSTLAFFCYFFAAFAPLSSAAQEAQKPQFFVVEPATISDRKAVFATVQSTDEVQARARIAGTIGELKVDEGSEVKTGEVIAVVVDEKLALQMRSLTARIEGLEAQLEKVKSDLARAEQLIKRGVISQARLDELRANHDVTLNNLRAARADLSVIRKQAAEGEVLAPAPGRVLKVPVTVGSVVLPGEQIATIAANRFILRLELPERHARFMREGDRIETGPRGLDASQSPIQTGAIIKVYPKLENGRVIADAEVSGLGDYFVGERTLVWISVDKRQTFLIPREFAFQRYSQDYVRLMRPDGEPADIVVQLGQRITGQDGRAYVEVLSGLKAGDKLVKP